jgi:predicted ABC-type transport system involved in lysophospholipase L1 biosynthesis ATPase subunit
VTGGLTMCLITHDRDVAARAQREVRIVDGELTETTPATVSGGVGG